MAEDSAYIEGCEAVFKAREYGGKEKRAVPHHKDVRRAKQVPAATPAEKEARAAAVAAVRQEIKDAREFNEEVEIADFVNRALTRFSSPFGQAQLDLCRAIVSGGPDRFFDRAEDIILQANALPQSHVREERIWRRQEVRNAHALLRSRKLAKKYYPEGVIPYDPADAEAAYDMPDSTKAEAKARRKAMKAAATAQNLYSQVAGPYLAAKRTLGLYEGYARLDEIVGDYDRVVGEREERLNAERAAEEALNTERRHDIERHKAEKRMKR